MTRLDELLETQEFSLDSYDCEEERAIAWVFALETWKGYEG